MKPLLCYLGLHRWTFVKDDETRYSKGGILAGHCETGLRLCGCGKSQEMYRFSSMLAYCTDDTGWRVIDSDEKHAAVYDGHLPMQELDAWRKAENERRHAEKVGHPCGRCQEIAEANPKTRNKVGTYREVRSDHGYSWWVGYECDHNEYHGGFSYYRKKSRIQILLTVKAQWAKQWSKPSYGREDFKKRMADRVRYIEGAKVIGEIDYSMRLSVFDTDEKLVKKWFPEFVIEKDYALRTQA